MWDLEGSSWRRGSGICLVGSVTLWVRSTGRGKSSKMVGLLIAKRLRQGLYGRVSGLKLVPGEIVAGGSCCRV